MDFKQVVMFRQVRQETQDLHKALGPMLAAEPRLADLILVDLAQVVRVSSRSRQEVGASELLAFLTIYALLKNDQEKLNIAMNSWDFLDEERVKYQKTTLKLLLELTEGPQTGDQLIVPSILKRMDEEKGSNWLETAVNTIYKFAQVIVKADGQISMQEMEALSQIWQQLHSYQPVDDLQSALSALVPPRVVEEKSSNPVPATDASTPRQTSETPKTPEELAQILEQALAELNDLVGMNNIKEEVKTLANFLKVQKIRAERGLAQTQVSLHSVFCGPPGTGKTTVARLMSRIFQGLGFLKKGHLVETDRAGMVAGYVGQTSKKVDDLVNSALDGVLFIDEAYALLPKDTGRDFGQEAIDILLKRMEDYRDRLVVIVAGYTDEMTTFIESNPGLKSRFNRYFYFDNFTPEELLQIFEKMGEKSHFKLTVEAREKLLHLFEELYVNRDRTFGNGRLVRNLFEKTIEKQANRLAVLSSLTDEVLTTLLPEDIPIEAKSLHTGPVNWQNLALPASSPNSSTLDREAVTAQLQATFQPRGIQTKTAFDNDLLQVILEADPVPEEQATVSQVRDQVQQIAGGAIAHLTVYARRPGDEFPVWTEEIKLN